MPPKLGRLRLNAGRNRRCVVCTPLSRPVDERQTPLRDIDCAFCRRISVGRFLLESPLAVVFRDAFPLNPGHIHVAARRHVEGLFDLSRHEREALWDLVEEATKWLNAEHSPDGINLAVNIGEAAGQTVPHAHIHLIPRYWGDVDDPRGGVRHIHPDGARYYENRS